MSGSWSPVVLDEFIPIDLEKTSLKIKTNSTAGSGEQIRVMVHPGIGSVGVMFIFPFKFFIGRCMDTWVTLPVQPPEEVLKTWTFRKTTTTLSIECNEVEVLHYQFSDSSNIRCVSSWGGDVVEKISFHITHDTASDSW